MYPVTPGRIICVGEITNVFHIFQIVFQSCSPWKLFKFIIITLYTLFCNLVLSSGRFFVQFLFGEFCSLGDFLNCRLSGLSASFTRVTWWHIREQACITRPASHQLDDLVWLRSSDMTRVKLDYQSHTNSMTWYIREQACITRTVLLNPRVATQK